MSVAYVGATLGSPTTWHVYLCETCKRTFEVAGGMRRPEVDPTCPAHHCGINESLANPNRKA